MKLFSWLFKKESTEEIAHIDIIVRGRYTTDIQAAMKAIDMASNEVRGRECYNMVRGRGDKVKIEISRQGYFLIHLPIMCPTSVGVAMNQDFIKTLSRHGLNVDQTQDD